MHKKFVKKFVTDIYLSKQFVYTIRQKTHQKIRQKNCQKMRQKLQAHQNRNAPSGLTSAHCDWVCHAMHKNVCMLEWHAIKHPYLPTYLGCMIELLIYFYAILNRHIAPNLIIDLDLVLTFVGQTI